MKRRSKAEPGRGSTLCTASALAQLLALRRPVPELFTLGVLAALWAASIDILWKSLPFQLAVLGIPIAVLGILESANIAANLLTELPAGVYVDRKGRRPAIVGGFLVMGLCMGGLVFARDLYSFVLFIGLFSAADSFFLRGVTIRFFEVARAKAKGRGVSLFHVFAALGGFAGLAVTGAVALARYDAAYAALSLALVAAAAASGISLPRSGSSLGTVTQSPTIRTKRIRPLREFSLISDKRFLAFSVVLQIFMALSAGASLVFLPALGLEAGLEPSHILLLFATLRLASAPLSYLGGWISDRLPKEWFFVGRPASSLAYYLLLSVAVNPLLYVAGASVTLAVFFFGPGSSAYFMGRFLEQERGRASSVNTFFTSSMGVISPLVGAFLWTLSPRAPSLVATLGVVPAIAASLLAIRRPSMSAMAQREFERNR